MVQLLYSPLLFNGLNLLQYSFAGDSLNQIKLDYFSCLDRTICNFNIDLLTTPSRELTLSLSTTSLQSLKDSIQGQNTSEILLNSSSNITGFNSLENLDLDILDRILIPIRTQIRNILINLFLTNKVDFFRVRHFFLFPMIIK